MLDEEQKYRDERPDGQRNLIDHENPSSKGVCFNPSQQHSKSNGHFQMTEVPLSEFDGVSLDDNLRAPDIFASQMALISTSNEVARLVFVNWRFDGLTFKKVVVGQLIMPVSGVLALAQALPAYLVSHKEIWTAPRTEDLVPLAEEPGVNHDTAAMQAASDREIPELGPTDVEGAESPSAAPPRILN